VPGVTDLSAEANKGKPQLVIKVNREAASRYGINADEILEVVQAGIGGSASTLIDGTKLRHRRTPGRRLPGRSGPIGDPDRARRSARAFSQVATPELDEGYSFVRRDFSAMPCCRWTSRAAMSTAS
jgi:cobalt-zinc-cadmium resistance protein CzcA